MLEIPRHWLRIAGVALAAEKAAPTAARRQREELQFLPAALEVMETPPSPAGRALMWMLIALFSIALAWSFVGKLDIVAVAQGKLVPSGRSKTIQPLEAGIVKAIRVENGEHVVAGQVLIELDPTEAAADAGKSHVARVDAQLAAARAQALLKLVNASGSGEAATGAPKLEAVADATPQRWADAERLAEGAWAEYRSKLASMRAELIKRQQQLQTAQSKIAGLRESLPIVRDEAADYKALMGQNYVPRHAWLDKEQTRIQTEQDLVSQQSMARELQDGIAQQQQDMQAAAAQFRREQLDALNQARQQLAQNEGDEIKSAQRERQLWLKAPVAGTVQQLDVHTIGGVVTPAQALMVVVPDDAGLEIEAQVLNQDIGFVRAGQTAEVKLEAFPYTHYGTLPGEVMFLSHDAVKDDKLGLVYPARVRLLKTGVMDEGRRVALGAGMAATVEIKTERRRILEYLLEPLARYRSEAMRER